MRVHVTLLVLLSVAAAARGQSFTEVSSALGIDNGALAQGCAWGDYDDDGYPDLYLTNNKVLFIGAPKKLYRYDPASGSFQDKAPGLGLDDSGTAFGAAWSDYDNDGRIDLFLVRGVITLISEPPILYHNDGPTTPWSKMLGNTPGLPAPAGSGRSVAWADFDNDGFVDLAVTNGLPCNVGGCTAAPIALLRNRGDGTFENVTAASGIRDVINGHGLAWGDYDNDGWPDLFLVNHGFPDGNIFESNALFHNLGAANPGRFEDVTATMKVAGNEDGNARGCFGAAWSDYDNDGYLDLYVTCGYDTISSISGFSATNLLYHNQGGTSFRDVSVASLTADPSNSLGCTWGDYDNDGHVDLYVANGISVAPAPPNANHLFRNTGLGVFLEGGAAAGVASTDFSQATAGADFDRDGDLDLYVVVFNTQAKLYRNQGGGGHWLELRLIGTRANRSAIGARAYATTSGLAGQVRQLRDVNGGSGYLSQDDLALHFGLGTATEAEVEIHWPGPDFCVQKLGVLAADQVVTVIEDCTKVPPNVLRAPYQTDLSQVFPLPIYQPLPATPPFLDSPPADFLYFYAVELAGNSVRMVKSGAPGTVALYY